MKDLRGTILVLFWLWFGGNVCAQTVAPSWTDFVNDQAAGKQPVLSEYSYAGYHFSEKEIPDVSSWTYFDVSDYGAVADDAGYDDQAIQDAINAAELHDGPAVVFFPTGRFVVSEDNSVSNWIQISRDSLVLKGSGSGAGGTEIFMDKRRVQNGHWQFQFSPPSVNTAVLARISKPAERGDFVVYVDDASSLEVGMVINIYHKSEEFARAHFGDLELSDDWTRLFGSGGGMNMHELHEITDISGDRLTLKNPIQTVMPQLPEQFVVRANTTISEVGVEDILFVSDWENYGESFVHHKDDIHDYGWNAVEFDYVRNAWMRNCEFRSWSQVVNVQHSIGVTIENVEISGDKGHASFATRRSYGLLVKDCIDHAGQHHGPGTGYAGVNTVYLRHEMQKGQSVDSHSGQPYATLIDDVQGGDFDQNGGPHESYPHHGQGFTFWNFRHSSTTNETYDFWSMSRNGNTYANPLFVGFQADTEVEFRDAGLDELNGEMVEPRSLFEAQFQLRMDKAATMPAVKFITPVNAQEIAIGDPIAVEASAQDPDGTITGVTLYLNDIVIREDTSDPYEWGKDEGVDPGLFNLDGGQYNLKIKAVDNEGNEKLDSITVTIGSYPSVEFEEPTLGDVIDTGNAVEVLADANDTDGSIVDVSLYVDDELVRTINQPPYHWGTDANTDPLLFNLKSGVRILKLTATDDDGLTTLIEQNIRMNNAPTVSFLVPEEGQAYELDNHIILEVAANDSDDAIDYVDMYMNNKKMREELSAPFEWGERSDSDPELYDLSPGEYEFRAVAYDTYGSKATAIVNVVVNDDITLNLYDQNKGIHVYPNPVVDHLIIDLPNEQVAKIEVWDVFGRKVKHRISQQTDQILVSLDETFPSGMYILSISLKDFVQHRLRLFKD